VQVEDHPLDYARFEGVIPAGEYGGGEVIVWDFGHYTLGDGTPKDDAEVQRALDGGKLELTLHGVKLQGGYVLVRTGERPAGSRGSGKTASDDGRASDGDKTQWLLIKRDDPAAMPENADATEEPWSVRSGLWTEDLRGQDD
jgi:bifunctional non-homologous end joining protein LigD